ncbi:MAG TPA: hypothetical protein VIG51_02225 [Candidatus Baltobacteraceae bacterium]|jgi:hypothetical protein
MMGTYISHPYNIEVLWLWIGFVPAFAAFALLGGAKMEEAKRSFHRSVPSRVRMNERHRI